MAKIEVKTEETRCDRCGRKVTQNGKIMQFVDGVMRMWPLDTSGVSFFVELCKGCSESAGKWWDRGKAGEE